MLDVANVGATESPAQGYALYCDDDPLDQLPAVAITDDPLAPIGLSYATTGRGIPDGTPRPVILPPVEGMTDVVAGTLRRQAAQTISPVLAPNTRTMYEHALRVAPGQPMGKQWTCELKTDAEAAFEAGSQAASLVIGPAQFTSR